MRPLLRNIFLIIIFSLSFLSFLSSLSVASLGEIVVINSKKWSDVYAGLLYARLKGVNGYFLTSPNPEGILKILPRGHDIILIESSTDPYVPTLDSILRASGFRILNKKEIKEGPIDLLPPNITTIYIVEEDRPTDALIAAPLAVSNKGWVIVVNSDNVKKITNILSGKKIILIGYFQRDIRSVLEKYKNYEIIEPSKFRLSLLAADYFLKQHPTTQILISDGKYIEEEIFSGYSPLIIVGTNLLPEETIKWISNHSIKSCVIIGTHLTYVGEQIRKISKRDIGVFVKWGQALPGSPIFALTMMPLPSPQLKLRVESVMYDPEKQMLLVNFKNDGNIGIFELTTLRILDKGKEIASAGDSSPYFIGSGESLIVSYSLYLPPEEVAKNLTVEFFTSYGESPESLDRYLTNMGKFGPPLTKQLIVKRVNDRSELNVTKITYYTKYHRIGIKIENLGKIPTYFIVKLPSLKVQGVPKALQSKIELINSKEKEVFIPVTLDPIDIKENSEVDVILDYGERKNLFVKSMFVTLPLQVSSGIGITGFFISAKSIEIGAVVGVVGVVIGLWLRKRKIKRRKKRKS